jgi:hypothetical protein
MKRLLQLASILVCLTTTVSLQALPVRRTHTPDRGSNEHFTGSDALAHLDQLKSRHKDLKRAAAELGERGFKPTETVTVMRSNAKVRGHSTRRQSATVPMQGAVSDASGELVFWEWSDGDTGTWEGVIYIENYVTGANSTWTTQMDVQTPDFYVIW